MVNALVVSQNMRVRFSLSLPKVNKMIVYNQDKIKKEIKEHLGYDYTFAIDRVIDDIIEIVLSNVKNKTVNEIIEEHEKRL